MQGYPHQHLPLNGQWGSARNHASTSGAVAAHATTAALYNPYFQQYSQCGYHPAPHYAQAYTQHHPQPTPGMTTEGYTLSSTYVPGSYIPSHYETSTSYGQAPQRTHNSQLQAHWYQPGTTKCARSDCTFIGSAKAVEIHMMDRHLIYPPGWEKRKRQPDWDADPSLKGKPIPILGTTLKLDTPEAIAEWIAERKKRYPTASRVEEKEQKIKEAIARGQLSLDNPRFPHNKRRRLNEDSASHDRGRGRSRGRGRGRGTDCGWQGRHGAGVAALQPPESRTPAALPPKPVYSQTAAPDTPNSTSQIGQISSLTALNDAYESDNDSDSDGAPEVLSSKAAPQPTELVPAETHQEPVEDNTAHPDEDGSSSTPTQLKPVKKPIQRQPRRQPRNPFAAHSSLLRNLLTPEIRMTVSNLSQAIRFLVDNDFLDNIELKPGQASEKMIEVISSSTEPARNQE